MTTAIVIASGPSLTAEDAAYCRGRGMVIVVNTTFRDAPWADVLYSNDHDWYETYLPEIRDTFAGRLICGHPTWRHPQVETIPYDRDAKGLAARPGYLPWGMNSGGAALGLARVLGASRIVMLGYDQQWTDDKPRKHGAHPAHLQNQKPGFHRWAVWFAQAAKDFADLGIDVVNCTPTTSLTMFRRAPLREAL